MLPHLRRKLGPDHPHTLEATAWVNGAGAASDDRTPVSRPHA
jgi:hypothetical protein